MKDNYIINFLHSAFFNIHLVNINTLNKLIWPSSSKKLENGPQKLFQPAFRCAQHPKAGQNTQQVGMCNQSDDAHLKKLVSWKTHSVVFVWTQYDGGNIDKEQLAEVTSKT